MYKSGPHWHFILFKRTLC